MPTVRLWSRCRSVFKTQEFRFDYLTNMIDGIEKMSFVFWNFLASRILAEISSVKKYSIKKAQWFSLKLNRNYLLRAWAKRQWNLIVIEQNFEGEKWGPLRHATCYRPQKMRLSQFLAGSHKCREKWGKMRQVGHNDGGCRRSTATMVPHTRRCSVKTLGNK